MARNKSDEKAPEILKAAEEKMDRALVAYSQENADPEIRKHLIDDLQKSTNEFLKLREELSQRRMRDGEQTVLEELVFCDCEHSADCKIEHWKICKIRIQKDVEASRRPPE
jgi:predicted metal-binding transcription factor (methanogenesis marker protein 9)